MKKLLKWGAIALATPLVLLALCAALLYLPPVQNWAVRHVSAYASEQTGLDITVGRVRLEFPLRLGVDDVLVLQPTESASARKDTMASVGHASVDVQLLPLLHKQVEIDALELNDVSFNTMGMVDAARVRGQLARLYVRSHGIDLRNDQVRIDMAQLSDGQVDVQLADSVPPDTTESHNEWKILVDSLLVTGTDVTLHMPGDTLCVAAHLGRTVAANGHFDLGDGVYRLGRLEWTDGALAYDNRYAKPTEGLDYNHLSINDIRLAIDSLYYGEPQLSLALRSAAFSEKSGLRVDSLSGRIEMDSVRIHLPDLRLKTPNSQLAADFEMDLNAFADRDPGKLYARVDATLGKQDLMQFLGGMPTDFVRRWPNQPLTVKGLAHGNMQYVDFTGLNVSLPTALKATASGYVANMSDPDRLKADIRLQGTTDDLGFVTELLDKDLRRQLGIPRGIGVDGRIVANGQAYEADLTATEGGGRLRLKGDADLRTMDYHVNAEADRLPLQHFVKGKGLTPFSGTIVADGRGTDLMSPMTRLTAKASIRQLGYEGYDLSGMQAEANVANGRGRATIDSHNALLDGNVIVDALMNTRQLRATIAADVRQADLYKLRISDTPLTVGLCGHVDVASDMNEFYKVQGLVADVVIADSQHVYRPEDVVLDVLTRRDTTHAVVDCGDFHLRADAQGGYKQLMRSADQLTTELSRQLKERHIDQVAIRQKLPTGTVHLTSGRENFICKMLQSQGYEFDDAVVDMAISPIDGINGSAQLTRLLVDSIQLDTVRLFVESDTVQTNYRGQVRNNEKNPQYTFNALFDGQISDKGLSLNTRLYDADDRLGINLGAEAAMEPNGIRVRLNTDNPVLGYKTFKVNDDNYLFLSDDRRVSARLDLKGAKGEGVQIYTNDENLDALQDLTVSLNNFNLEEVLSVLPYTPDVTGMMNGDFHVIQTASELSVSSALSVKQLTYEQCPMGNVSTEFVYMPREDGTHSIDGILLRDDIEVATLSGSYNGKGDGHIDAQLEMLRMPLLMVNGFIPEQLFGLYGYAEGSLTVAGTLKNPQVNGEVFLDSTYLVSEPYGMELRFANDPVRVVGSHLLLENFEVYSHNDSPLNVAGDIDFSNLDRIMMNVRMRAQNYQIINAKENSRSVAFGKAFVNFFGVMSGPLSDLTMRGKLDVLGTTDVGYILRDSPLTTDNQLDELVKFTDFKDTTETVVSRPSLTGFNMDMTIEVSQGAHVMAYLNTDKSNYIDLMGGGTLRMQYTPADNLTLRGKYTLSNGEMKYSLPIIPLKTFTIRDGSYLEFTGDPMNPTLNITATESTKATVSNASGVGHSVAFDCGVIITKTLSDMGLEFTLDAPEDMSLHNELMVMSKEQRGKLAVSMLTTGMYLADGNTNAFSMNSALSSFLNSEINNLTGNALRTLDLSFGLDNSTDASGNSHMDYSFKFAKRFWNNRLKIAVGGMVSTGAEMQNQNKSFFDNVSLEYRLDDTANKYVTLFFENNAYDWLDGYTQEYGAGFIWRRSLQKFKDIFSLRNERQTVPAQPRDSVANGEKETERQ